MTLSVRGSSPQFAAGDALRRSLRPCGPECRHARSPELFEIPLDLGDARVRPFSFMKRVEPKVLKELAVFGALDAEQLKAISEVAHVRTYARGSILVQQGDPGDAAYVVLSGFLKVCISGTEGRVSTLGLMERGDLFGEVSLLDGGARSATVIALTRTDVLVLGRPEFLGAVGTNANLALALLTVLGRRLRALSDRSDDIGSLCVGARIARRLVSLAERFGQPLAPGRLRISVRLSHQEIGDLVGATRESVNKHLKLWEREGLIAVEGGHLVVPDLDRLRATAEHFDAQRLRPATPIPAKATARPRDKGPRPTTKSRGSRTIGARGALAEKV